MKQIDIYITDKDKLTLQFLINAAKAHGYKFDDVHGDISVEDYINCYHSRFPHFRMYPLIKKVCGCSVKLAYADYIWPQDATKIIELISSKHEVTVKLNDSHDAIVTKDKIKVGCQTFSIDIIDKLVEARNSFN